MDSSRKVKISDIPRVNESKLSDIFIVSRDIDEELPYDKTFTIQMSDILRSIRKDFRYWTSYEYNEQDKSLNIYDEEEIFAATYIIQDNGGINPTLQLTAQTNSPVTSFEEIQLTDTDGIELKILP